MLRFPGLKNGFISACAGLFACLALAGCGGDGHHPDTGYGEEQPVPSTMTCADLCRRSVDCGGHLCAEDKGNDLYITMFASLESQCESECTSKQAIGQVTSSSWTCLFNSSCRQVFQDDACHIGASYYCK